MNKKKTPNGVLFRFGGDRRARTFDECFSLPERTLTSRSSLLGNHVPTTLCPDFVSFTFTYLITYNKFFRHHKGFRSHGQICESTSKIIVFMSKKINWWALQDLNLHGIFQPRERPSRLPFRQATHLGPASAFKYTPIRCRVVSTATSTLNNTPRTRCRSI